MKTHVKLKLSNATFLKGRNKQIEKIQKVFTFCIPSLWSLSDTWITCKIKYNVQGCAPLYDFQEKKSILCRF